MNDVVPATDRRMIEAMPQQVPVVPQPRPIGKLAEALAVAQAKCPAAEKNGHIKSPKIDYKYAMASDIRAAAKKALAGCGLAVVTKMPRLETMGSGNFTYYCLKQHYLLVHGSGEFVDLGEVEWPLSMEGGMSLGKAYGAAQTSAMSYTLSNLLCMPSCDPSDDLPQQGNVAAPAQQQPEPEQPPEPEPEPAPKRTAAQQRAHEKLRLKLIGEVGKLAEELAISDETMTAAFRQDYHCETVDALTVENLEDLRTRLTLAKEKKQQAAEQASAVTEGIV